jgi:ParB family chromosome partitioning protein
MERGTRMSSEKKVRGLSALISSGQNNSELSDVSRKNFMLVKTDDVFPNPEQPRKEFDDSSLQDLSESIKSKGVIQPIIVSKKSGKMTIIAGERRFRAAKLAGLSEIPVVIKENISNEEIMVMSMIENLQREDLNPIEEAVAFKHLSDVYSMTQDQISKNIGKSRSYIANSLRLIGLPDQIKASLSSGRISVGHAKVLLGINDPSIVLRLFEKIIAENISVRSLEEIVLSSGNKDKTIRQSAKKNVVIVPPHINELEGSLREYLGTKVSVQEGLRKGRILIEFYSVEDFDRIIKKIGLTNYNHK